MINNIKNNTISKADTKKKINELNKIKNVETKGKRLVNSQETLLSLFDDLKTIFSNNNNSNNNSNNSNNNSNNNNKKIVNEDNNVNDNDNDNESDDDYDSDNDDEQYNEITQINKSFKKIDETKSFEDQIDILKKLPCLSDYWYMNYYEDNKETNLRLFKLKFAHVFNDVDDNLFKEIFGLTSVELADELINTTIKEENQMFINNI